ncbi:MAG: hypothetical protein IJ302_01785 [Clostridia bacterium]|nr:hypothetical protein [Clostridia bacterium]
MTPFWILNDLNTPAHIDTENGCLILENPYLRRVIDCNRGMTSLLSDGDGTDALSGGVREFSVTVDGVKYIPGTDGCRDWEIHIRDGHETEKRFAYQPASYNTHPYPYPAPGKCAELIYHADSLHFILLYEIFDGMPLIRKTLYVENGGDRTVTVDHAETECLSLTADGMLRLYLESDYTGNNQFGFLENPNIYYDGMTVSAHFDMGPDYDLAPGTRFRGMQVYSLLCQSTSFDHRRTEIQHMYRRAAPWVCEAPLFMHLISDDSDELRRNADILSEIGFDMMIQSFGSGVNLESQDEDYIARVRSDYEYVHSKGLKIGGYTLAIIRDYQPMHHDCATNGDHNEISRCLCTRWSEGYWNQIEDFLRKTNADFIEIDGPYHFYTCTGNRPGQTEHLHKGLSDSRYMQWLKSTVEIYTRLRNLGIYINTPDWFFLSGTNKICIGYEEIGYSQPRLTQLILGRIYGYKSSYYIVPSMGWSFLPIEEYQGGGDAAKYEPLDEHLEEYDWALAQAAASGIWPCIRGKRLYDTERCKQVVKYWTDVIHRHKVLLNSNTVHVYPPKIDDGMMTTRDLDVILQENHTTRDRLFLMVFNQSAQARKKTLVLPAFFTGLTDRQRPADAPVSGSFDALETPHFGVWYPVYPANQENALREYAPAEDSGVHMSLYEHDLPHKRTDAYIDVNGNLILTVSLPPMSYTYYVGYAADETPEAPVAVPEGKPFGYSGVIPSPHTAEDRLTYDGVVEETRKINFAELESADSADAVYRAMGLGGGLMSFIGHRVILRHAAYDRIHALLYQHHPDDASMITAAIAFAGFHLTNDETVPEDEVWLLNGWRR